MKVGIVGASGYAGVELLRLCAGHPDLDVTVATAGGHTGDTVAHHTPSLSAAYPDLAYSATDVSGLDGLDLVFLALPHGQSQHLVPQLVDRVGAIIDLAADFRLHDPSLYPIWYGEPHTVPALLDQFVYGLPELHRDELHSARLIAAPGCYPTAAILGLAPFVDTGAVQVPEPSRDGNGLGGPGSHPGSTGGDVPAFIVDAASGVSGAGRAAVEHLQFGSVDEDFTAYGLLDHRHTAEMEQSLGAAVLFTPHLAPMVRGILATCYARPTRRPGDERGDGLTTQRAMELLHHRYDSEPFVIVTDEPPSTKATSGSNCVHITARVDERTGWVVVLVAIDNLVKGAAGQAIQCANLSLGLPEGSGLPITGVYP
ncbi:MAG: N-acetyl-gamma-glutamyl-phosphate reductase [Acidimicrobiales bacterium]